MSEGSDPTAPVTPRLGRLHPHNVVIDVADHNVAADPEGNESCVTI